MWGKFSTWADNKFISNWREALRLRVIQLHTGITILAGIIYNMARTQPDLARQALSYLPKEVFSPLVVNVALLVWLLLGAYARLVYQPPKDCP